MKDKTEYIIVEFSKAILIYGVIALSFISLGLFSFITLEHEGHWLTGMNNQVVWGVPHVFAIFLIIAASGILNIASISSVVSVFVPICLTSSNVNEFSFKKSGKWLQNWKSLTKCWYLN